MKNTNKNTQKSPLIKEVINIASLLQKVVLIVNPASPLTGGLEAQNDSVWSIKNIYQDSCSLNISDFSIFLWGNWQNRANFREKAEEGQQKKSIC